MKIKQDFITNSSSTCYVVCLPNNKKWILENMPENDCEEEEKEGMIGTKLEEMVDTLLQGKEIYQEEFPGWFGSITDLCCDHKFVITSFEVGSGAGQIMNLTATEVNKMAGILGIDWVKKVTNGRGNEQENKGEKTD